MLYVIKAIDPNGEAVCSSVLPKLAAVLKFWEFKTSGFTQIQAFDAATNQPVDILNLPD